MVLNKIKKMSLAAKIAIALLTLMTALVYVLAYTSTGLSWMLNRSISDPSATISISSVSNKFGGITTLNNLSYKSDFAEVQIENITMQWNPLSIFSNQLLIENMWGENLSVNFKNASDINLSSVLAFPKSTILVASSIKGLEIKSDGKTIYTITNTLIDNLYLDESYFAESIILKPADGQWVKLSGQFGFSTNSVINLTTETSLTSASKNSSIRAKGTMVGNVSQLRFLQHVSSPFSADIEGRIKHLFTDPSWVMDTKLKDIDLSVFTEGQFLKNLSGNISINGQGDMLEISSDLEARDIRGNNWMTSIVGHSKANLLEFVLGVKTARPPRVSGLAQANFTGSYDLTGLLTTKEQITQGLKIKGQWNGITVPLNTDKTVLAKTGNIEFDGSTYTASINAAGVQLHTLGPTLTKLALKTRKNDTGDIIFNGLATSPNGELQLSGSMARRNNSFELDNLFLSGNNFTLVRKPQAHIIVSPNLSFVRKNGVMTSTGTVNIPTANIQLQEFKNTIAAISSVINSRKSAFGSTGYVDVKFGKSVWLHGYGLNAHVTGDLSLLDISSRQLVASGELNVLRGNYRKLDKEHSLSGGRLKFNNHDLDNPDLELNLTRASTPSSNKIMGKLQKLYKETKDTAKTKSSAKDSSSRVLIKNLALMVKH